MERILTTMTYTDQPRTCRDCGNTFSWTAGEQEFYASRGLVNPPSRCPDCRAAYKARTATTVERPHREMHAAVCAECGGQAILPFEPRHDRPVYCSNCFDKVRATGAAAAR